MDYMDVGCAWSVLGVCMWGAWSVLGVCWDPNGVWLESRPTPTLNSKSVQSAFQKHPPIDRSNRAAKCMVCLLLPG